MNSPGLRGAGSKYGRADSVLAIQALDGCSGISGSHRYGRPLEPFNFRLEDHTANQGVGEQEPVENAPDNDRKR